MSKKPNFLFIITDQQRADHLGCYGNNTVATPNIDAISANGRQFERFYVANPVCMPNRASIMTGRLSSLHGVRHNGISLSQDHNTFVELLRDAGYDTALIGKSHLQSISGLPAARKFVTKPGRVPPSEGLRDASKNRRTGPEYEYENELTWDSPLADRVKGDFYGFSHFEVATGHADQAKGDYALWARAQNPDFDRLVGPENALSDNRFNTPQAWRTAVPEELYSTNWIAGRADAYLTEQAKNPDRPFFLQMSFPDPHHPFTPPGKYWGMYDPADIELPASFGKGGLPPIHAMQEAMKKGTDARDNQSPYAVTGSEARASIALTYAMINMIDDAIGQVLGRLKDLGLDTNTVVIFTSDHGDYMGDHGLMLKLLLHYQGLIRVPFIWQDPVIQVTGIDDGLASSIDISSTILSRAGIQPFNGIQGRDLFSTAAPEAVLIEEDSQRSMTGFDRPQRVRTIVTRDWRMSLRQCDDWDELYDLRNDPHETNNRFNDPAAGEFRRELMEIMLRKMIELQDTAPLPGYRA